MASISDERILMSSIEPVACIMIISHCHLIAGGKKLHSTLNTEILNSLASETNCASYMKKTTNSEKYKA
jgi:hypothetical protein